MFDFSVYLLFLFVPSSCSSWLFCRAFMCRWNLYWAEHRCSRYWQVFWLSVWNRCLIPSEVFCKQIFFFYHTKTQRHKGCYWHSKWFHVKTAWSRTSLFFLGNSSTAEWFPLNVNILQWKRLSWYPSRGILAQVFDFHSGPRRWGHPLSKCPAWCQSGISSLEAHDGNELHIPAVSGTPLHNREMTRRI